MAGPKKQEDMDEELCDHCPLEDNQKGVHCYGGNPVMCEGSHCDQAYEAYLEQFEEDEEVEQQSWVESLGQYR